MTKIFSVTEMKALVFVVLEHQSYVDGKRSECVSTDDLARHLGLEHKEVMKVLSLMRKKSLVCLRERRSKGFVSHGYDGSLFGVLTPTVQSIERVRGYLRVDKRRAKKDAIKTASPYGIFGEKIIGNHLPVQGGAPGLGRSARRLRGFKE